MIFGVALICFTFAQLLMTFLILRAPDPYHKAPWMEEEPTQVDLY